MANKRKSHVEVAKTGLSVWFAQYLDDITCGLICYQSKSVKKTANQILQDIETNRIVIYVKEGCGYCKAGKEFLFNNANGNEIYVKNGESIDHRFALKKLLAKPSISFPVIIIDGIFHGGSDDVVDNSDTIINIIKTNKELLTIKSGHENIEWSPYIQENSKFKPFVPPGGKNKSMRLLFCNVQTHVYSNVLRLWSLFHVILLLLIWIFLQLNINIYIVVLIIWILTIDIFMFEILGSNPFSFLSTLSTIIIWKRRGNAVTSIPYKVVFFIYLNALIKILYDIHFVSINSVNTNVNKILILSAIVNSSMLALTRF